MHSEDDHGGEEPELIDIRQLTAEQLARLGMAQIAYVKAIMLNGAPAFAIHAADGTPMAVAGDRDLALAAIRQHEMVPTLVH
ncbi:MAG: DUF1150 family protein [Acidisphaera sp.]|nr:DUF1150 family protein [Acidisphaera sp.]MBV9812720.1 DUF1150 family protein [Acetobacteraceae bacterium]